MSDSFLSRIDPPKPPKPAGPMVPPNDAYTKKAFEEEVDKVRNAPEGERNHQLFSSCAALAEFVNSGTLTEITVRNAMADAARSAGLDELEIERTIESAFHKTEGKARTMPDRPAGHSPAATVKVREEAFERAKIDSSRLHGRILSPSGLRDLPKPAPLIGDVLDRGTTALLYAHWGSGKSFIALDWACSVATGRQWQGRHTDKARVLYVVAEGAYGFAKRVKAWETAWKMPVEDGAMDFLPIPVNLMTEEVDDLCQVVEAGGYEFIILDTLARCTVGAEENSAKDTGIVIDSMTRLVDATPEHRGVALAVHHTGKDGHTLRGSSAYASGVDTVYFAEKSMRGIRLVCEKRKDGPDGDEHQFRLAPIMGTESCALDGVTGDASMTASAVDALEQIFRDMFMQTGASEGELRAVALERGMSRSDLYHARQVMVAKGHIKNTGSSARPFWKVNYING